MFSKGKIGQLKLKSHIIKSATAADHVDGGLEIDDTVYAAKKLSGAGIDAIEISTGTPTRVIIKKNDANLGRNHER